MGSTWTEETKRQKRRIIRKLRRFMKDNELSQTEAAELLGFPGQAISRYYRGETLPTQASEDKLEAAMAQYENKAEKQERLQLNGRKIVSALTPAKSIQVVSGATLDASDAGTYVFKVDGKLLIVNTQ